MQLDLNASSPALLTCAGNDGCVSPFAMHTGTDFGTIRFWDFGGINNCPTAPSSGAMCGDGHFIEDVLTGARPKVMSDTFYFVDPLNLTGPASAMRVLPGDGSSIRMGRLTVRVPMTLGNYTLNVMNASQANPDLGGGDVRWGYGIDVDGNALTTWRLPDRSDRWNRGVSGRRDAWGMPDRCEELVSADPVHRKTLWRTTKNLSRLTFDGALSAAPTAGQILIQEMIAGGTYGPDVSANFTFTLESGGTVLKVINNANTLQHRKWYAIRNTGGWAAANAFLVQYVVQMGDANNDGRVLFTDLANINAGIPTDPAADTNRRDINADARVLFTDMAAANARIPSDLVPVPAGH